VKQMSALNDSAAEVLRQGEALLLAITDEKYTRRIPAAFNSAIGGHYRHCLDHFQSLLEGLDRDEVNYDHRARNKRIENDREFALAETQRLTRACWSIPAAFLDCSIRVRSQVNYEATEAAIIGSTVGREIMYAVAHCIHHYALIAVMCTLLDVPVPNGFGVAPSTLKYQTQQRKAA
jgi:uncharacterized damage-inducible protein DinB